MKVVAIVQARMGSTRLPGKVLKRIGGKSMLARVVRRVQRATLIDQVVVATTIEPSDEAIVTECKHLGVDSFRGNEQDVLDRYYQAANEYGAGAIVRITADCPLIDPEIVDRVVHVFLEEEPDCASNTLVRTYPRGLGLSVISMGALARAHQEAREPHHRTHVPLYIHEHPDLFRLVAVRVRPEITSWFEGIRPLGKREVIFRCSLTEKVNYSHQRWTVDTLEDLTFVQAVYAHFGNEDTFGWREVLAMLARDPELMTLNLHIAQKEVEEC